MPRTVFEDADGGGGITGARSVGLTDPRKRRSEFGRPWVRAAGRALYAARDVTVSARPNFSVYTAQRVSDAAAAATVVVVVRVVVVRVAVTAAAAVVVAVAGVYVTSARACVATRQCVAALSVRAGV